MAGHYQLQPPYELARLPKPLNSSTSGYVFSSVVGRKSMSRKRKRPEVVVGTDGESLNIYDVSSSRLVTSYPIPPVAAFTCPPSSTRWRASASRSVARYTYIATRSDPHSQRIALHKDRVEHSGNSTAKIITRDFPFESSIIFLAPFSRPQASPLDDPLVNAPDIITVSDAGHISCLDGETLVEQWRTDPTLLSEGLNLPSKTALHVDNIAMAPSSEFIVGALGGKDNAYRVLSEKVKAGELDPDILLVVTSIPESRPLTSHLHILAIDPNLSELPCQQSVFRLASTPLSSALKETLPPCYTVDAASGTVLRLSSDAITTFSLEQGIARLKHRLNVPGAMSALRISKTSTLVLSTDSLKVYNPLYESLHACVALDAPVQHGVIITHFPREQLVLMIIDDKLVAAQLDTAKPSILKHQAGGQFIDALGRGNIQRDSVTRGRKPLIAHRATPGTLKSGYWDALHQEQRQADELLEKNAISDFEELLATRFGIPTRSTLDSASSMEEEPLPEWQWPATRCLYGAVDRRWVLYSISRAFNWVEGTVRGVAKGSLICTLSRSHLVKYLIDAGHLGLRNIRDAFRGSLYSEAMSDSEVYESLVDQILLLDHTCKPLNNYIAATKLGPAELLVILRALVRSMEPLVIGEHGSSLELLTQHGAGTIPGISDSGDVRMGFLEAALKTGKAPVDSDWDHRRQALSLAMSKLWANDPGMTTQVMRQTLNPQEVLILIVLLRTELVQGAWTSLYLDTPQSDHERNSEDNPPPKTSITIIAELLCRCVDSIGQDGWLLNDAALASEGLEKDGFINALKLQISVALEGAESASYLHGLVSEVVRYANSMEDEFPTQVTGSQSRPITLKPSTHPELPLGLRVSSKVSGDKVLPSGEIVKRSKREVGHVVSQRVQPYRTERIMI